MVHRFLTLSQMPELRIEPANPDAGIIEIELSLPVEVFWQAEEIIQELKFLKGSGFSTSKLNMKLMNLVKPYVVYERDRITLLRGGPAAS